MANFVIFSDGQMASRDEIIAVKKVKFNDGPYVRVQLSKELGVIDIRCEDEEKQAKTLQDVTSAILNKSAGRDEEVKH